LLNACFVKLFDESAIMQVVFGVCWATNINMRASQIILMKDALSAGYGYVQRNKPWYGDRPEGFVYEAGTRHCDVAVMAA
jgi:hypothetical protein